MIFKQRKKTFLNLAKLSLAGMLLFQLGSFNSNAEGFSILSVSNPLELSQDTGAYIKDSNTFVLVSSDPNKFADGLSASNIAFKTNAKILLVDNDTPTKHLFNRESKVYVMGGAGTLFGKSINDIYSVVPEKNITRLSGKDRYETNDMSLKIANSISGQKDAICADGRNFPDTLSVAGMANDYDMNILLVNGSKPMKSNVVRGQNVKYIVGGHNSVKSDIAPRISGASRLDTSIAINRKINAKNIILASANEPISSFAALNVITANNQKNEKTSILAIDMELYPGQKAFLKDKNIMCLNIFPLGIDSLNANLKSDIDEPLSTQEQRLVRMVNDYRASKGLHKLPVSKSLTQVARTHANDVNLHFLHQTPKDERGIPGNMHSWSNHGKGIWTPVVYTDDHHHAEGMWNKPKEVANLDGAGYEIAYSASWVPILAESALSGWQGSPGHNDVIIEKGTFNNTDFESMGVAIRGMFSCIWFRHYDSVDQNGYFEYPGFVSPDTNNSKYGKDNSWFGGYDDDNDDDYYTPISKDDDKDDGDNYTPISKDDDNNDDDEIYPKAEKNITSRDPSPEEFVAYKRKHPHNFASSIGFIDVYSKSSFNEMINKSDIFTDAHKVPDTWSSEHFKVDEVYEAKSAGTQKSVAKYVYILRLKNKCLLIYSDYTSDEIDKPEFLEYHFMYE